MALVDEAAFFDTSVFIRGIVEIGDPDEPAQWIMDSLARAHLRRPSTAWHCCLEFYAVTTRLPEAFRIPPARAAELVEAEIVGRCDVLDLPAAARLPFLRAAALDGISGGRLYDAHVAEVARLGGARVVVTENRRHFAPLLRHGLRVLTPREFKAERRR